MINVQKNEYRVEIDAQNPNHYMPSELGMAKGDMIVFRGEGDPVRFPSGNAADKVPVTDPTSETGWVLKAYGGGGGGGGGSQTVTLVNNTGATLLAGTVVTIDTTGNEREVRKATTSDTLFFIVSDDTPDGEDVECYAFPYSICSVLCADEAIAVGDTIKISSIAGIGSTTGAGSIGLALTGKTLGDGVTAVKVLLKCFSDSANYTISTTDLVDGESALPSGHLYFYYEEPSA